MHCNEECPCSAWATAIAPCSPMLQSEIRATTSVTHRQINTHRATTSAMHTQHRVVESRTERKTGQCGINDAIILWSLRFCIDVRPWSISARTIAPLSFKKQPSSCTGSAKQHAALISVITHQASQVPHNAVISHHTPQHKPFTHLPSQCSATLNGPAAHRQVWSYLHSQFRTLNKKLIIKRQQ